MVEIVAHEMIIHESLVQSVTEFLSFLHHARWLHSKMNQQKKRIYGKCSGHEAMEQINESGRHLPGHHHPLSDYSSELGYSLDRGRAELSYSLD